MKSSVDIITEANKTLDEVSSLQKNISTNADAAQTNYSELGSFFNMESVSDTKSYGQNVYPLAKRKEKYQFY